MGGRTEIIAYSHHRTDFPVVSTGDETRIGIVLVQVPNPLTHLSPLDLIGLTMDRLQNLMKGMGLLGMVAIQMKE